MSRSMSDCFKSMTHSNKVEEYATNVFKMLLLDFIKKKQSNGDFWNSVLTYSCLANI